MTEGSRLAVVSEKDANAAVKALWAGGVESAAVIGRFTKQGSGRIIVR